MKNKNYLRFANAILFLSLLSAAVFAQTTEFTYQGSLKDGATTANGNYDLEFQLYAAVTGGAVIGTRTRLGVPVTNGVFTVRLDFTPSAFNGTDRFLEIAVKPAGSPGGFQQLLPRQPITYAPYSFRSLNATNADTATRAEDSLQLGGIAANQFVLTGDARLTNARVPLPGSGNYIQSSPAIAQSGGFNIIGKGSAGTFDVITTYQIGGNRVLGVPGTNNIFVGVNAGDANTTGTDNAFVGRGAGFLNTEGSRNSFFGRAAGNANTTNSDNSFFGFQAGLNNIAGDGIEGSSNSFFGSRAGESTTIGFRNSFFGFEAGRNNTSSDGNSIFGASAGRSITGSSRSNSFFGADAGVGNTSGSYNVFVGIGAGDSNTTGNNNSFFGAFAGSEIIGGDSNVFIGDRAGGSLSSDNSNNSTLIGARTKISGTLNFATAIGADATVSTSSTIALGRSNGSDFVLIPGLLTLPNLAVAGSTTLCRNAFDRVGTCSSSLRYKTNVQTFMGGLDIVGRLRPITFNWKDGDMNDVGFAAEEVEKIEPLLATFNKTGQIEGVKYAQITTVLVNAVNEQQEQIEQQREQIEKQKTLNHQQQRQIDALKRLVCSQNPQAALCKEEK